MRPKFRKRLSYANVMSTLALFIALGGSSYAAVTVSGASIKNRSIPAVKLKRNAISGVEVRESRLGRVPWAATADRVGEFTAEQLMIGCPSDTFPTAGTCVERAPRRAAAYGSAVLECTHVGTPSGSGRRLPTHGELQAALGAVTLAPGGELTSNVYPSDTPGELNVLVVIDQAGGVALTPDRFAGARAYRCVTDPTYRRVMR